MQIPRAVVVRDPARAPRPRTAIVALAIIAVALALVWRMVETERGGDQLMSAASAATRSTE
jgi:hypothetical protein